MTFDKSLAVLIPAYQAAPTLGSVIQGIQEHLPDVKILVVDDGSTDQTAAVAHDLNVDVFRSVNNQGKGHALQLGFEILTRRGIAHILCLDADGQHLPQEAAALVERFLMGDVELVIGNRSAQFNRLSWDRQISNRLSSWWLRKRTGLSVRDSQSGFRVISGTFANRLRDCAFDFSFESQMLLKAAEFGYAVSEVPISAQASGSGSHIHRVRDTRRFISLMSSNRFRGTQ
jgi:glycosyltransferase involved in cell wall biosynthesis